MSLLHRIDNQQRVGLLKKKIKEKKFVQIIEVHNGLSSLIVNNIKVDLGGGKMVEFDGFWESSLTDSASKGLPDIEVVSFDSRLLTINQILDVTNKPMIVDGDTGGDFNQFAYMVRRLERAGVSMVIIEDKVFPKRNSLESGTNQILERPEIFVEKIKAGILTKDNPDFMIVARIESLIAGLGIRDALERAQAYLSSGADGIMIHSKANDPQEILLFAKHFNELPKKLIEGRILVCAPTTYNSITCQELVEHGFSVIIHANHLLRSSYKAMKQTCEKLLLYDRSLEVDPDCASVSQIFETVGFLEVKERDKEIAGKLKSELKVIIPAAGATEIGQKLNTPVSLIDINGKVLLERQLEAFQNCGLDNIILIKGFQADKFKIENIRYYLNPDYEDTHILESLFCAEKELEGPLIYINADILLHPNIIHSIITCHKKGSGDIVLIVDDSYEHHKHDTHKKLDLVRTNKKFLGNPIRMINNLLDEEVQYIGKKIDKDLAHYEFIGVAYFSKNGVNILKNVYYYFKKENKAIHESISFSKNSFTDIIQAIVNHGYSVKVLRTHKGWLEIHNEEDIELAKGIYK